MTTKQKPGITEACPNAQNENTTTCDCDATTNSSGYCHQCLGVKTFNSFFDDGGTTWRRQTRIGGFISSVTDRVNLTAADMIAGVLNGTLQEQQEISCCEKCSAKGPEECMAWQIRAEVNGDDCCALFCEYLTSYEFLLPDANRLGEENYFGSWNFRRGCSGQSMPYSYPPGTVTEIEVVNVTGEDEFFRNANCCGACETNWECELWQRKVASNSPAGNASEYECHLLKNWDGVANPVASGTYVSAWLPVTNWAQHESNASNADVLSVARLLPGCAAQPAAPLSARFFDDNQNQGVVSGKLYIDLPAGNNADGVNIYRSDNGSLLTQVAFQTAASGLYGPVTIGDTYAGGDLITRTFNAAAGESDRSVIVDLASSDIGNGTIWSAELFNITGNAASGISGQVSLSLAAGESTHFDSNKISGYRAYFAADSLGTRLGQAFASSEERGAEAQFRPSVTGTNIQEIQVRESPDSSGFIIEHLSDGNNEEATITFPSAGQLELLDPGEVQNRSDFLTASDENIGQAAAGTKIVVTAGPHLTWSTDSSIESGGWKLKFTPFLLEFSSQIPPDHRTTGVQIVPVFHGAQLPPPYDSLGEEIVVLGSPSFFPVGFSFTTTCACDAATNSSGYCHQCLGIKAFHAFFDDGGTQRRQTRIGGSISSVIDRVNLTAADMIAGGLNGTLQEQREIFCCEKCSAQGPEECMAWQISAEGNGDGGDDCCAFFCEYLTSYNFLVADANTTGDSNYFGSWNFRRGCSGQSMPYSYPTGTVTEIEVVKVTGEDEFSRNVNCCGSCQANWECELWQRKVADNSGSPGGNAGEYDCKLLKNWDGEANPVVSGTYVSAWLPVSNWGFNQSTGNASSNSTEIFSADRLLPCYTTTTTTTPCECNAARNVSGYCHPSLGVATFNSFFEDKAAKSTRRQTRIGGTVSNVSDLVSLTSTDANVTFQNGSLQEQQEMFCSEKCGAQGPESCVAWQIHAETNADATGDCCLLFCEYLISYPFLVADTNATSVDFGDSNYFGRWNFRPGCSGQGMPYSYPAGSVTEIEVVKITGDTELSRNINCCGSCQANWDCELWQRKVADNSGSGGNAGEYDCKLLKNWDGEANPVVSGTYVSAWLPVTNWGNESNASSAIFSVDRLLPCYTTTTTTTTCACEAARNSTGHCHPGLGVSTFNTFFWDPAAFRLRRQTRVVGLVTNESDLVNLTSVDSTFQNGSLQEQQEVFCSEKCSAKGPESCLLWQIRAEINTGTDECCSLFCEYLTDVFRIPENVDLSASNYFGRWNFRQGCSGQSAPYTHLPGSVTEIEVVKVTGEDEVSRNINCCRACQDDWKCELWERRVIDDSGNGGNAGEYNCRLLIRTWPNAGIPSSPVESEEWVTAFLPFTHYGYNSSADSIPEVSSIMNGDVVFSSDRRLPCSTTTTTTTTTLWNPDTCRGTGRKMSYQCPHCDEDVMCMADPDWLLAWRATLVGEMVAVGGVPYDFHGDSDFCFKLTATARVDGWRGAEQNSGPVMQETTSIFSINQMVNPSNLPFTKGLDVFSLWKGPEGDKKQHLAVSVRTAGLRDKRYELHTTQEWPINTATHLMISYEVGQRMEFFTGPDYNQPWWSDAGVQQPHFSDSPEGFASLWNRQTGSDDPRGGFGNHTFMISQQSGTPFDSEYGCYRRELSSRADFPESTLAHAFQGDVDYEFYPCKCSYIGLPEVAVATTTTTTTTSIATSRWSGE